MRGAETPREPPGRWALGPEPAQEVGLEAGDRGRERGWRLGGKRTRPGAEVERLGPDRRTLGQRYATEEQVFDGRDRVRDARDPRGLRPVGAPGRARAADPRHHHLRLSGHGDRRFAGESQGYVYTRLGYPTLARLETRLAALEDGKAAVVTASGMGAFTAALWSLVEAGDEILVDGTLSGCTFSFLHHGIGRFG